MDATRTLEYAFLFSSSVSNVIRAAETSSLLALLYLAFLFVYAMGWLKLRPADPIMFRSPLSIFAFFVFLTLQLSKINGQTTSAGGKADGLASIAISSSVTSVPNTAVVNGTPTTFRPIFTVPATVVNGATLIPNIHDPQAVDAQNVCPGYTATNVVRNSLGLTATLTLAGPACNVYGTDIDTLNLTVEYHSADRLAVGVTPAVITASNFSYYDLPDYIVHQPTADCDANVTSLMSDLNFVYSNDPTFSFAVFRVSTGDILFSTVGTKLVFEDQFVEFASALPENYNLYGLGETIHGLRLGNNFTKTMWAADVGDPID